MHPGPADQPVSAGDAAVNRGAATLNGQNMGSDEAYNFVFKGECPLSCLLDPIPSCVFKVFEKGLLCCPSNYTSLFTSNLPICMKGNVWCVENECNILLVIDSLVG